MSKLGFLVAVSVVSLGAAVGAWYYKYQLYGWLPSTASSELKNVDGLLMDKEGKPFTGRVKGECQDFCVWGGYSRGSPTRLPFVFEMQYARPDAIAGAKVEGPARSAGGSSLAPAIARREAAGALAREV